jgi:hypothetical protein
MTSRKLFYRIPAALLLGLIVGAPDIAQAVNFGGRFGMGPVGVGPRSTSLVPFNSIGPRSTSLVPFGTPPQPIAKTPPRALPPSSITTHSIGTQTDKSGIGRASRIIPTEGGPEGEAEGDNPL